MYKRKIEEYYLQHQSNYSINTPLYRLTFLGFMITINLAFYVGIYYVNDQDLWFYSNLKLFLLLLLIIINLGIYIIYHREHRLSQTIKKQLYEEVFALENLKDKDMKKMKVNLDKKDNNNEGITWAVIKIFLSLFVAIPAAFLFVLLVCNGNCKFMLVGLKQQWLLIVAISILFFLLLMPCSYKLFRACIQAVKAGWREFCKQWKEE